MTQSADFRVIDDSYREESPRGKWAPLLAAVLEGQTVFVPEAAARSAENALRQSVRGSAAKGRAYSFHTRAKTIDGEKGVVMWAEVKDGPNV